jgi:DNA polymerase elongation subunit (family B)
MDSTGLFNKGSVEDNENSSSFSSTMITQAQVTTTSATTETDKHDDVNCIASDDEGDPFLDGPDDCDYEDAEGQLDDDMCLFHSNQTGDGKEEQEEEEFKERPEDSEEMVIIDTDQFHVGNESWGTLGMRPTVDQMRLDQALQHLHNILHKIGVQITDIQMLDELPPSWGDISDEFLEIFGHEEDMPCLNRPDYAAAIVHSLQDYNLNQLLEHKASSAPCFKGFRNIQKERPEFTRQLSMDSESGPGMHVVIFGRTMDARTVCIISHGFRPWFHINVPDSVQPETVCRVLCALGQTKPGKNQKLIEGRDVSVRMNEAFNIYGWYSDSKDVTQRRSFRMVRVETRSDQLRKRLTRRLCTEPPKRMDNDEVKRQYPGFQNRPELWEEYIKLYDQLSRNAPLCRKAVNGHTPFLRRGEVHWREVHDYGNQREPSYTVKKAHRSKEVYDLENNAYVPLDHPPYPFIVDDYVEPITQFLYQRDIAVNSFIYFDSHVDTVEPIESDDRISVCQYEGSIHYSAICRWPNEEQITAPAGMVEFCFDIETLPFFPRFSESFLGDESRLISGTLSRSDWSSKHNVDVILVVGNTGVTKAMYDDPNIIVRCYKTVPEAMHGLRQLILDVDVDIITGYNTFGFDCPYLNNNYVQHIIPKRLRGTEAMHCFFLYAFPRLQALYEVLQQAVEKSQLSGFLQKILHEDLPYDFHWFTHEKAFMGPLNKAMSTDTRPSATKRPRSAPVSSSRDDVSRPAYDLGSLDGKDDYFRMSEYIFYGLQKRLGTRAANEFAHHPARRSAPSWLELLKDTVYFLWPVFVIAYPQWKKARNSQKFGALLPNMPAHEKVAHKLDTIVQQACGALRVPMVHGLFLRQVLRRLIEGKIETLQRTEDRSKQYSRVAMQRRKELLANLRSHYYWYSSSSTQARRPEHPAWHSPPTVSSWPTLSRCTSSDVRCFSSDSWWDRIFDETLRDTYTSWTKRYVNTLDASPMVGESTLLACFQHTQIYRPDRPESSSSLPFFSKGRFAASFQPYIAIKSMASQATGEVYLNMWDMHGRIQFDLLQWVRGNKKLDSYTLKNVTHAFFAHEEGSEDALKDDLGYREMFKRIRDPDPRKRAAVLTYSRQDSRVCARIMEHNHIPLQLGSLARLTNVPMRHIYNYGQQKRVLSQMARRAYELGYSMSRGFSEYSIYFGDTAYKGATVVEPKPNVYEDPVICLDFTSLYPTTMIDNNLCFSNLVQPSRVPHLYRRGLPMRAITLHPKQLTKKTYKERRQRRMMASKMKAAIIDHHGIHAQVVMRRYGITAETTVEELDQVAERGYTTSGKEVKEEDKDILRSNPDVDDLSLPFMHPGELWCTDEALHTSIAQILVRRIKKSKSKQFNGVTPVMLGEYLRERKTKKQMMKEAAKQGNKQEEEVRNKEQLAVKAGGNSIYGFYGSVTHALACKIMAAAITAAGRAALQVLFDYIEAKYGNRIEIVYGDTDSIMFRRTDCHQNVKEAIEFGNELADELTRRCFGHPMALEYEKVYCPYFLTPHPKRYAGHKYEDSADTYVVEHKGTPDIKRDRPNYIRRTYGDLLNSILDNPSQITCQAVFNAACEYIDKLAHDKCTIDDLQVSVSLNNNVATLSPGAQAWENMKKRQDPDTPQSGDRLSYAHIYKKEFRKNDTAVRDKTESVSYIRRQNLPLDNIYYLEQVRKNMDDIVVSMDPKGTSRVRVHPQESFPSHTLKNALDQYIRRAKKTFQLSVDEKKGEVIGTQGDDSSKKKENEDFSAHNALHEGGWSTTGASLFETLDNEFSNPPV